jgi:NAD(P)-dependent dehydrogenase (short-subunit alcohol dehydrogenase family)
MTTDTKDLSGRTAFVSGSTQGIGRAIAAMCVYLASGAASATTGGALRVDGGFVDNIVL